MISLLGTFIVEVIIIVSIRSYLFDSLLSSKGVDIVSLRVVQKLLIELSTLYNLIYLKLKKTNNCKGKTTRHLFLISSTDLREQT